MHIKLIEYNQVVTVKHDLLCLRQVLIKFDVDSAPFESRCS